MNKIPNRYGMPLLGLSDLYPRMRRVAAPEFATFTFVGLQSRRVYSTDVYYSDVVDSLINFDGGAGASATSPDSFTAPENILLTDIAVVTGGTDTKKFQILRGNQPTGDFIRHVPHLTTNPNRPQLSLGFRAGTQVRAIQKA
ncbi:hypothetical protein ES703_80764 [subsurface metagenome]